MKIEEPFCTQHYNPEINQQYSDNENPLGKCLMKIDARILLNIGQGSKFSYSWNNDTDDGFKIINIKIKLYMVDMI